MVPGTTTGARHPVTVRPRLLAGAQVVLLGDAPALFVERGGRSLVPLREPEEEWLRVALAALVADVKRGGAKRLAVERFDSEPVVDSMIMPLLVEAGFLAGPRRAILRAQSRMPSVTLPLTVTVTVKRRRMSRAAGYERSSWREARSIPWRSS